MTQRDPQSVEHFERINRQRMISAYGNERRAFQRETNGDGWVYWFAGVEVAYQDFLSGWAAALIFASSRSGGGE